MICEKSGLRELEFEEVLKMLRLFVRFETESFFKEFLPKAKEISPDLDDVAYFALALKLGCGIWSNDKRLKKQQPVFEILGDCKELCCKQDAKTH